MPENTPEEKQKNSQPVKVCAAIIIDQGKVMITLRPEGKRHGGFWEFPGGKVDPGESPDQALVRELKEELDINININELFETISYCYDWGEVLILAYLCDWQSGQIKHLEVADHRWVTPEQFTDYNILPADQPILVKLKAFLSCN